MNLSFRKFYSFTFYSVSLLVAVTHSAVAETVDFTSQRPGSTIIAAYRIYVPPAVETPRIRGIVFFYGGTGGDWRPYTGDPIWQDAVRSLGFALICADMNGYGDIGNTTQAPVSLANILSAAALATGHEELVNVPIVSTGVSFGGMASTRWAYFNPNRVICIAAQRGAETSTLTFPDETRNVHALFIPGSFDDNPATSPTVQRQHFNRFRSSTNPTGRAAWAIDWGSYHDPWTKNQSWAMSWSWIAESIALRYPANTIPSTIPGNPVLLNTVPLENGWLGHQAFVPPDTTGADYSRFDQIAPYSQYVGDKNVASWLPNETLARVYRAMNSRDSGYWTRTVIPLQRSLAIVGDTVPPASVPGQTNIPQLARWELGSTIDFTVDPREFDDVNPITTLEYYDGSTLLATQTAAVNGIWKISYTPTAVGIHSLTVVATNNADDKASAFRPIIVSPVKDRSTIYWRFEPKPKRVTDQYENLTLWESSTAAWRPTSVLRPATGPGSAFPNFDNENGVNTQALKFDPTNTNYAPAADIPLFSNGTNGQFTFEACINLTSATASGTGRVIASHGGSHATDMSWQLEVTSESSDRGARNLIFQSSQNGSNSAIDLIDSDLQLQTGVDYYVAIVYNPSDTSAAGATFYLKNLTANGPLQIVQKGHSFTSLRNSSQIFTVGSGYFTRYWHGLIDEVRFTNRLRPQSELLVSHVRTPYQEWLATNGQPLDTPATGDTDGDGVTNLMEFALDLSSEASGYEGRLSHNVVNEAGGDYLALSYSRPEPELTGISYVVESSSDLANWSATGITQTGNILNGGLRTLTLRDSLDLNAQSKRFMRLRVSQP